MATNAHRHLVAVPDSLMQFDLILPSQYFGAPGKQAPEHRLLRAVLRDALECLQRHRGAASSDGRRLFDEARRWFLADEIGWPYSFEGICEALDLDASAVRRRLRVALAPHRHPSATQQDAHRPGIVDGWTAGADGASRGT